MTDNELQRMQEEAIRRTREMQKRAEEARLNSQPLSVRKHEGQAQSANAAGEEKPVRQHGGQAQSVYVPGEGQNRQAGSNASDGNGTGERGGALDFLFRDKEKTLILGLILLLMDEKTDNSLLLALMYLLL